MRKFALLGQPPRVLMFATTLVGVASVLALGCVEATPIVRGELSDCYRGAYFAECGGDGTPRFGCDVSTGDCLWFVGGTVAEGFIPWSCADGRICCEEGPDPELPDPEFVPASWVFHSVGATPWNRERELNVDVSVDPTLAAQDVALRCERSGVEVDDIALCYTPQSGQPDFDHSYSVHATMHDTLSVHISQGVGLATAQLFIEVVPGSASGSTLARVCRLFLTDFVQTTCETARYPDPVCAVEGSLRLSAQPSRDQAHLGGVVVTGDVAFPDGLEVTFAAPL